MRILEKEKKRFPLAKTPAKATVSYQIVGYVLEKSN